MTCYFPLTSTVKDDFVEIHIVVFIGLIKLIHAVQPYTEVHPLPAERLDFSR